jgi:hypothetical protein
VTPECDHISTRYPIEWQAAAQRVQLEKTSTQHVHIRLRTPEMWPPRGRKRLRGAPRNRSSHGRVAAVNICTQGRSMRVHRRRQLTRVQVWQAPRTVTAALCASPELDGTGVVSELDGQRGEASYKNILAVDVAMQNAAGVQVIQPTSHLHHDVNDERGCGLEEGNMDGRRSLQGSVTTERQ